MAASAAPNQKHLGLSTPRCDQNPNSKIPEEGPLGMLFGVENALVLVGFHEFISDGPPDGVI
jgi:hypothetical protein